MKEKIKKRKREITLSIIISIVLLFFFSGFSIGKAFTETNISSNFSIAKPILIVDNKSQVEIKNINDIGIYEFTVKNYDSEGNVTQVDLEYNVEILTGIDENLELKIFKNNQEIDFNNNITQKYELTKDKKQEHNYKIEINCKSKDVEQIIQEIQIKVHSEQKRI